MPGRYTGLPIKKKIHVSLCEAFQARSQLLQSGIIMHVEGEKGEGGALY